MQHCAAPRQSIVCHAICSISVETETETETETITSRREKKKKTKESQRMVHSLKHTNTQVKIKQPQ